MDLPALLKQWNEGNGDALGELIPLVYDELRHIARAHLRRERRNHTLQPTALVNETYLRLARQLKVAWRDRGHFLAVSSKLMRHILIDYARTKKATKRGTTAGFLTLAEIAAVGLDADLVDIDAALDRLSVLDPRQARVVELRFFGGLTIEETSRVLGVCPATVKTDWAVAKLWLYRELSGGRPVARERTSA